jgi:hypothetical protein
MGLIGPKMSPATVAAATRTAGGGVVASAPKMTSGPHHVAGEEGQAVRPVPPHGAEQERAHERPRTEGSQHNPEALRAAVESLRYAGTTTEISGMSRKLLSVAMRTMDRRSLLPRTNRSPSSNSEK